MLRKINQIFNYVLGREEVDDDEEGDDDLIDQILAGVTSEEDNSVDFQPLETQPTKPCLNTVFRVGKITNLSQSDGIIDQKYFFDRRDAPLEGLAIMSTVTYQAFRHSEDQEWRVKKIITVHEEFWNDDDLPQNEGTDECVEKGDTNQDDDIVGVGSANKRTIIGKVACRNGREVTVRDFKQLLKGGTRTRDTRFSLDDVSSDFLPLDGDILTMHAIVEVSDESVDGSGDVLQVLSIAPCRARRTEGVVTNWFQKFMCGDINNEIYFQRDACDGGIPRRNEEVALEVIECDREDRRDRRNVRYYKWRAISVVRVDTREHFEEASCHRNAPAIIYRMDPELLKNKGDIVVQENTDFGRLPSLGDYKIEVSVTNNGEGKRTIKKFYIETKPSNLKLVAPRAATLTIEPHSTVTFSFDYNRNMVGYCSEEFVLEFGAFDIGRVLKWEVINSDVAPSESAPVKGDQYFRDMRMDFTNKYMKVQESRPFWVPGERPMRRPTFIRKNIKYYKVPEHIRELMTSKRCDEGKTWSHKDLSDAVKACCPELTQPLSAANYQQYFHSLLFIAEMDAEIDMARYTQRRVSFSRRGPAGEYLALEIPGLAEGRPSLLVGDSIVVSKSWDLKGASFQAYVHRVLKTEIWVKFNEDFQRMYNNEDYDVHFELNRSCIRKCHAALDDSQSKQACLWLFPKGVKCKPPQITFEEDNDILTSYSNGHANGLITEENGIKNERKEPECLRTVILQKLKKEAKSISNSKKLLQVDTNVTKSQSKKLHWFTKNLNHRQKEAVRNILLGEARPLPYVIFGPPGTGKTLTLVESVLQIYKLIGDSRILIATPSNSSANLIAERLLEHKILEPGEMVRLVAYHLVSEGKIPPGLLPYCATVNISVNGQDEEDEKIMKSFNWELLMHRRITVGTCITIGQLMYLDVPRGHYTHIFIDEAGQATEPEILIPLGFMAHETGQAILAGDPNQLGPVVPSNMASSYGLSRSLLARLLPRFPYRRDATGFPETGGYDPRLVTRLTANYRSLPDILELPSMLFYDSDLDPMVSDEDSYESKLLALATSQLGLPHCAVVFHGIQGHTLRDEDSPSYWNPQEWYQVVTYVQKLLDAEIKKEDIGVITPYQKQGAKIRQFVEKLNADEITDPIKVGSVEEFQGQERMVIILSTVRSLGGQHLDSIGRNTAKQLMGFLNNPERLNVAISRARSLLIICGDPVVLSIDNNWRTVVKYCYERNSYVGVGLPKHVLED